MRGREDISDEGTKTVLFVYRSEQEASHQGWDED